MTRLRELEESDKRLRAKLEEEKLLSEKLLEKLDKLYYIMKSDKRTIARLEKKIKFIIKELYNAQRAN